MADLPYVQNYGTMSDFFRKLQTVGRPPKATTAWIESLGFKSKNDRDYLRFLKAIGFADQGGTPTDRWTSYKNSSIAPSVMAEGIRAAWLGLFDHYADAERQDDEAIRNWMRFTAPEASENVITRSLRTFRSAAALADFAAEASPAMVGAEAPAAGAVHAATIVGPTSPARSTGGPVINLNIELQIPATENADIYDKFFAAMKKHLFPDV